MNHFELAALTSKVDLAQEDIEKIGKVLSQINSPEGQVSFFKYCFKWKLAPWTYTQLKKNGLLDLLNENVRELFQKEYDKIKLQNESRNHTATKFLAEFKKEGIDVVILKGNYLAHTCYKVTGYKRMNDFDILIHKEDWDRIQDVYLRLGYIPLGFGWSGEKEEPASFSHVGMSYISADYTCIIGSQWGLKSPTTAFTVDSELLWSTAKDFDFCGLEVKSLSPEYNLLHLILHLGVFKCGIRDCMDLYNLVRIEKIDWKLLHNILVESNAVDKAVFALDISKMCVEVVPQEFIAGLDAKNSGFLKRRIAKRKRVHSLFGDFQYSYNDYFQDIEKVVIYFNIFPKFHTKIGLYFRILRLIYFPKTEVALKLNDKLNEPTLGNKITSAIKAPFMVFSLIAQEIGWKFTCLLFIKLGVDLLMSTKNYFMKSKSYFDYLKEKGIDPSEIQKVVKNIQ